MTPDSRDKMHHCPVNASSPCRFNVTVHQDMVPPISVYYKLWPYHQNFADYFQSIYWPELLGRDVEGNSKYLTQCKEPVRITPQGERISPCGMQAKALFNDTFAIENVAISENSIAWESDISRFKNPSDYGSSNVAWLWQRFPSVIQNATGVRNEHFAVWVRPDAYPEVRKPYGWISTMLPKGTVLTIEINASYPVSDSGVKELLISETSAFGGRDESFGWFLLVFFAICLLVSCCICCLEGANKAYEPDSDAYDEAGSARSVSSSVELLSEDREDRALE